jgi:hypothetical protein
VSKKKPVVIINSNVKKVKMRFATHQYYNDLKNPIFYAGEVYELEGADWIQRWLKRGGEIVDGEMPTPKPEEQNPSVIVSPGAGAVDNDEDTDVLFE